MSLDMQLPRLSAALPQSYPYASSLSSSASSSSSSVFSVDGASSQSSISSSLPRDSDCFYQPQQKPSACGEQASSGAGRVLPPLGSDTAPAPAPAPSKRPHPRRSSAAAHHCPPPLVRQGERKIEFVDNLVESATQIVEVIWPLSVPSCREGPNGRSVLPLRTFIQETLRRSRTSYSTLQVALYYLVLIKPQVPKHDFTMEQPEDMQSLRALQCGRRMFLAALILASKYLQDRNYSARAWSKISGLKVSEINTNEMAFLEAVNWGLHIIDPIFERWREIILHYTPSKQPPSRGAPFGMHGDDWKSIIPLLTPELDTIPLPPSAPAPRCATDVPFPRASPVALPEISRDVVSPPRLPRYLEPKPDVIPPTPSVPRMGHLPTPQMTPQSAALYAPAAGTCAAGSRRPSMSSAMATAQNACMARMTMDVYHAAPKFHCPDVYNFTARRPSLAPSTSSLSSSPESMVSDTSSRLSRASSISSVSSSGWAPDAAKLARLATCRNAKLPYPAQQFCPKEASIGEQPCPLTSEPASSPDFENFRLSDPEPVHLPLPVRTKPAPEPGPKASPSRKRARSSMDHHLQQNVRHILQTASAFDGLRPPDVESVAPDGNVADSSLPSPRDGRRPDSICSLKAMQSPTSVNIREGRLPVQKDLGRKRTCCASEAVLAARRPGPGMWEGIL